MKSVKTIVYITRDAERANSIEESENYVIVSNKKGEALLDTYDLLKTERVEKIMEENKDAAILVFQNTSRIEKYCAEKKWKLLNPSAELSKKMEEKISQYEWLGELQKYLPATEIKKVSEIKLGKNKIVVQFNHAHTGHGTFIVSDEKILSELKQKFPERPARVADFIDGPVFTLNIVVAENGIFPANINYQITGLTDFTDLPFSTIGNDWKLPLTILSEKERKEIEEMARALGARAKDAGWLGLFGIDVILDEKSRKIYLLEINARQPAGTTCESMLQKSAGKNTTTFEAHMKALLGEKVSDIQKITNGAQIILRIHASQQQNGFLRNASALTPRNTESAGSVLENHSAVASLIKEGFTVTEYENTKHNAEILRIRSEKGIMESHGKLNSVGEKISSLIFNK